MSKRDYRISVTDVPKRTDLFIAIAKILNYWDKQGTPLELKGSMTLPHVSKYEPEMNVAWEVKQTKQYVRIAVVGPEPVRVMVEQESTTDGM